MGIMPANTTHAMRRPSPTSRPICWLAILALIAHAWLPLLHAMRPATGTRVMLCSALAPGQWIVIPDDTLPEGAPDKALQAILRIPVRIATP